MSTFAEAERDFPFDLEGVRLVFCRAAAAAAAAIVLLWLPVPVPFVAAILAAAVAARAARAVPALLRRARGGARRG